jgi:recombination protein RecR
MKDGPLDQLMKSLAGLPGMGPRSARRAALHLLVHKQTKMEPLMQALQMTMDTVVKCNECGNLDLADPCRICTDVARPAKALCVVASVADLWAIERTGAYRDQYHILEGVLSALDGISPRDLRLHKLYERVEAGGFEEIILALSATVDGQATAHYITDKLHDVTKAKITKLAHGVPVGGELDYLDEGTISTALKSRANM